MLQLSISEKVDEFRKEFASWLEKNTPPAAGRDSALDVFVDVGKKWQSTLAEGGWIGMHWPKEYGGGGMSLVEEAIVQEELVRARAPQVLGLFGLTMVGPVLIRYGTDEQKERFLSDILHAKSIWCQGFSEPNAGSDLAAIKTRARVTDEGFYVTGQKIWTSFAQVADWCFLLCRTSDEAKRHQGMSYLLVDMKSAGIDIRPLKQITGDEEFNEVFFDEVFIPKEHLVGEIGSGWKIAISTLMYERVVLTFARQLQSEVALRDLIDKYRGKLTQSQEQALAQEVARACSVRALAYEHLLDYAAGKTPGPEGSLDKLLWSESFQSISKFAMDLHGRDAAAFEGNDVAGVDVQRYLYSRGRTIAAGTSEIQRSIIAERVMELPRLRYSI